MKTHMGMAASALVIAWVVAFSIGSLGGYGEGTPQIVKVSAKRFEYTPKVITLKKGVPVILELTSEDRMHGFNLPVMNLRADLLPGKKAQLKLTPQKVGEFDFFCDVFCGSGHESMSGKINVID